MELPRAAMVAALAVAVAFLAGVADAAPAGGQIELWASAGNNGSQHVVFVGAIGDYGSAVNVNKNGKPNPNGNYVKMKHTKGTFMLDVAALNKAASSVAPQVASHATCSAANTATGEVTFLNGTGLYKGISGTANVTLTYGGVGSRYKSGPKKGQCKQGDPRRRRHKRNPRRRFGVLRVRRFGCVDTQRGSRDSP